MGVSSFDQEKFPPPQNPQLPHRFPSSNQAEWNFLSKHLATPAPKPFLSSFQLCAEFPKRLPPHSALVCLGLSCLFICDFLS